MKRDSEKANERSHPRRQEMRPPAVTYAPYSEDTERYELEDGFALRRAQWQQFAVHYVLYRNVNLDFMPSFEVQCAQLEAMRGCFWIMHEGQRVGGVIMKPNYIEGLFLEPPFTDRYRVLSALKPILIAWSDSSRDVLTSEIVAKELDTYHRLGFTTMKSIRRMVRPTERLDIRWESPLRARRPEREDEPGLAAMFRNAFSGMPTPMGEWDLERHRSTVRADLEGCAESELLSRASTVVLREQGQMPVGACLIGLCQGVPTVSHVAVRHRWRRQGICTRMLQWALTALFGHHTLLTLTVAVGTPAESAYYDLGFLPGPEQVSVYIPAGQLSQAKKEAGLP